MSLGQPLEIQEINFDDYVKIGDPNPGDGRSLYIRPFVIGNEYAIQAVPSKNYKFMIICAPATLYYTKKLKVLVARKC